MSSQLPTLMIEYFRSRKMKAGSRLPSERALSECFGTSRKPIRAALDYLERASLIRSPSPRIRTLTDEWDKYKRLSGQTVGIVSQYIVQHGTEVDPRTEESYVLCRAGQMLQQEGAALLFLSPDLLRTQFLATRNALPVQSFVLSSINAGQSLDAETLNELRSRGSHVFLSGENDLGFECDCVYADHEAGAAEMVRHFARRGCRRIGFVSLFATGSPWMRARIRGYRKALGELGLPRDEPRVVDVRACRGPLSEATFAASADAIARAIRDWLEGPHPVDAIMVSIDPDAYRVAAACRRLGKIPNRDVLIGGYDNSWRYAQERAYEPTGPLLTCDKRKDAMAEELTRLLLERGGGDSYRSVPVAPTVVELVATHEKVLHA